MKIHHSQSSPSRLLFILKLISFILLISLIHADEITCFGILANETTVCSGNGKCIALNQCQCPQDKFIGEKCEIPVCFSIPANETTVCSGFGKCLAPNKCDCKIGSATGDKCEIPVCFGIPANETTTCSGNGKCTAVDKCECNKESGMAGLQCQLFTCKNLLPNDENVCSGHGTCVGKNKCACNWGFEGDDCAELFFFDSIYYLGAFIVILCGIISFFVCVGCFFLLRRLRRGGASNLGGKKKGQQSKKFDSLGRHFTLSGIDEDGEELDLDVVEEESTASNTQRELSSVQQFTEQMNDESDEEMEVNLRPE